MSLVAWIKGKRGPSGFGYASTTTEVLEGVDLTGKTMAITGANSGLGLETAQSLSNVGAHVVALARSMDKAQAACDTLSGASTPAVCELSDPTSVRACVDTLRELGRPLDALICNAGIMALPERTLVHGHEKQFFTNHVGHFMLVTGLLEQLGSEARVVMLSSGAHAWAPKGGIQLDDISMEHNYSANKAYGQSKLANLLFARSLAKRFEGSGKTANAVHPGVIATNLSRHMNGAVRALIPVASAIGMKSIPQGAATQTYVAAHPDAAVINGEYLQDCNVARSSYHGRNLELAERLWARTEEIVASL